MLGVHVGSPLEAKTYLTVPVSEKGSKWFLPFLPPLQGAVCWEKHQRGSQETGVPLGTVLGAQFPAQRRSRKDGISLLLGSTLLSAPGVSIPIFLTVALRYRSCVVSKAVLLQVLTVVMA